MARSLRLAYPGARLIAVDYSNRSSGLHWREFDDVWLQRPWSEIHLPIYRDTIADRLSGNSYWISGLDLETHWLAENFAEEPRVLIPSLRALKKTRKPMFEGAEKLGVKIPAYLSVRAGHAAMHAFCREWGWQVWVKGPHYEARRVNGWEGLQRACAELAETWSPDELFLQAHSPGTEESMVFVSFRGQFLSGLRMQKCLQTTDGKTWAGRTEPLNEAMADKLGQILADCDWTGGGELEFVRNADGELSLIDWNPRFPAWIHGATFAGENMPARLVERAGGGATISAKKISAEFTRVVIEVPVRSDFPLPSAPPTESEVAAAGKHPSGMPDLWKRLNRAVRETAPSSSLPDPIEGDLMQAAREPLATPRRVWLRRNSRNRFDEAIAAAAAVSFPLQFAYSIKTNPDRRLLGLACAAGMLAEAISPGESALARDCGFASNATILNGPLPSADWKGEPLFARFHDSLESWDGWLESGRPEAAYVGPRLRSFGTGSRFGIDISDAVQFTAVVERLRQMPRDQRLGLHFHASSDTLGVRAWWRMLKIMLKWGRELERASGRRFCLFDAGGGWFADDWSNLLLPKLEEFSALARAHLPGLERCVLEPGKALAQPSMALVTRVQEIRGREPEREIVVDAAISDLPMARFFPHRVAVETLRGWRLLGDGNARVLGRICMETDILATGINPPPELKVGDRVALLDAGAYDVSMAYPFGGGGAL